MVIRILLIFGVMMCVAAFTGEISNVARMRGTVVVVDSQNRDRWGSDGYHPEYVHDGNTDGTDTGARTTSWASDNWEVTHTIALIFPKRVRLKYIVVYWAKPRGRWTSPKRYAVHGFRNNEWIELAQVRQGKEMPKSIHTFEPVSVDAIRLVMPPEDVGSAVSRAGNDRRLWIAELEVMGQLSQPQRNVNVKAIRERIVKELRRQRDREDAVRVKPLLDVVMQHPKPRGFMAIISREDLKRGRRNLATHKWARTFAEGVKKDADWWLDKSDDYIYSLVPEGNPRAICPQFEKGCPIHGGARYSFDATLEKPYQWRCKHGGEWWYDGAVVTNPTTGKSVTVHDNGIGWLAPTGFPNAGRRYFFVAAYRYFLIGKLFSSPYEPDGGSLYRGGTPVVQLALAYALTDDTRYAHKCAVMLNRLAELYRTYDGCVEGPSQRQDGYIGQTFERFLVQNLILACDLIWDTIEGDSALRDFFAARGNADYDGDGSVTGADFTYNLQRNLLGYIYEYLHRLMPYMDGDFLMYEMTALAALAHCLGNSDIAKEAMESDLGLRVLLNNSWFRDGKYIYDSCGYNVGNARTPLLIAEWLHGFRSAPRYPEPIDLYHHPDYRMSMLFDFLRYIDCDGRVPQIGDCGGSRRRQLRVRPTYDRYDERALVRLPEQREFYLSRLYAAAGQDLNAYRDGRADWWLVFHAGDEQQTALPLTDSVEPRSHLFPDSGIAILRAGRNARTRQHVCITFSKGAYGHGHTDKLAINIFRYGYDLSADLGYPTTWTDIKATGWTTRTASHCTVMLDERTQRGNVVGRLHFFAVQSTCDVVEASAESAYPQANLYRRTIALVRDEIGEPLYMVDIFRVAGAATRDYLFHSLGKPEDFSITARAGNLNWIKQTKGSLAGEDIEPMTKADYSFLFDVARAKTNATITARWISKSGQSQPDRYLLTRRRFRDFVVEFTMTRTGEASGKRERAGFVFGVDPANQYHRHFVWLDAGGKLPVGKPVQVRIEVSGKNARVFLDGKLYGGRVDTSGSPLDEGVVGFLHYYNYSYNYNNFILTPKKGDTLHPDFSKPLNPRIWSKIDPTYSAGDGVLRVCDSQTVGLNLHLLGSYGREIIRAKAEGHGVRGKSPLEGHLIARDRADDKSRGSSFVAVIEAHSGDSRVLAVDAMDIKAAETSSDSKHPTDADALSSCDAIALRVKTLNRVDYIVSALDAKRRRVAELDGMRLEFRGRFALATTQAGRIKSLGLVGSGFIRCGGRLLESPGDVRGKIVGMDVENNALIVKLKSTSPKPSQNSVGRHLLVHNPAFLCPAVYKVTGVREKPTGLWRIELNMPFMIARGVVGSVNASKGAFATRTPVMKLRVNPGLFNGKRVRARASSDSPAYVLNSATESAFILADPSGIKDFPPGGEYIIYDVGVGDQVELVANSERQF